jgi:hypothetical protein
VAEPEVGRTPEEPETGRPVVERPGPDTT